MAWIVINPRVFYQPTGVFCHIFCNFTPPPPCQPTELIWAFLFHKFSNFTPPDDPLPQILYGKNLEGRWTLKFDSGHYDSFYLQVGWGCEFAGGLGV